MSTRAEKVSRRGCALSAAAALLVIAFVVPAVAWPQAATDTSQAREAREILQACGTSASDVIGIQDLESACPGVGGAITDAGYDAFLSDSQRLELSGDAIDDLAALAERYEAPLTRDARTPDAASLAQILDTLETESQTEAPLTWSQKLKQWLLERLGAQMDSDSWLARWLQDFRPSPSVINGIVIASIVGIIVLALVVLINELRIAGVFRRGARASRRAPGVAGTGPEMTALENLESVAPADRPSLLLRMLISALVRSGRLHTAAALTHRELSARAGFDDAAHRECFQRVAGLAERTVYGGVAPTPDADPIIAAGRELHARLNAGGS